MNVVYGGISCMFTDSVTKLDADGRGAIRKALLLLEEKELQLAKAGEARELTSLLQRSYRWACPTVRVCTYGYCM